MTVAATPGATTPTTPAADQQQQAPAQEQQAATPASQEQPATPPAAAPEAIGDPPAPATPEGTPEGGGFTYQETGDAALDVALGFIGSMGLGPDHPAVKDAVDGKFERLDAALEAMGDKAKGYQRYLNLAKDAYERSSTKATETQQAITAAVHEAAGDDKTWAAVKDWAGKNADPAEKEAINAMLQAGPVQARAAAIMLTQLYRGAGGTVVQPANPTNTNAGATSSTNNGALSPADYTQAVRDLRAQMGSRMDGSPEYQALQARRRAWRG